MYCVVDIIWTVLIFTNVYILTLIEHLLEPLLLHFQKSDILLYIPSNIDIILFSNHKDLLLVYFVFEYKKLHTDKGSNMHIILMTRLGKLGKKTS